MSETETEIAEVWRSFYPNGHPRFLELLADEANLHNQKNHDYASGGVPLGNFERVSTILKQYPKFPFDSPAGVMVVYMLKQLDALLWGMSQGIEHKVEGPSSRCQDVAVYAKLINLALQEGK